MLTLSLNSHVAWGKILDLWGLGGGVVITEPSSSEALRTHKIMCKDSSPAWPRQSAPRTVSLSACLSRQGAL